MQVIHRGHKKFLLKNFHPPIMDPNFSTTKPVGGLWTCPIDSINSWENIAPKRIKNKRKFRKTFKLEILAHKDRILEINCVFDLLKLPSYQILKNSGNEIVEVLDYKKIIELYDIIWLTTKGLRTTHYSKPLNTQGWDCESVLILNPYAVKTIE